MALFCFFDALCIERLSRSFSGSSSSTTIQPGIQRTTSACNIQVPHVPKIIQGQLWMLLATDPGRGGLPSEVAPKLFQWNENIPDLILTRSAPRSKLQRCEKSWEGWEKTEFSWFQTWHWKSYQHMFALGFKAQPLVLGDLLLWFIHPHRQCPAV